MDLTLSQAESTVQEFLSRGADPDLLTIGEGAPDDRLTMNAEVFRDSDSTFRLFFSTVQKQMRESLRLGGRELVGLAAHTAMRLLCDAQSYEDIKDLLDLFPDHVVEFSTYEINLGNVPQRNTLIWEVRRY